MLCINRMGKNVQIYHLTSQKLSNEISLKEAAGPASIVKMSSTQNILVCAFETGIIGFTTDILQSKSFQYYDILEGATITELIIGEF